MSDVVEELARVRRAFDQPTLTLLHQRMTPVVVAIFRSSFSRETRSVAASRFHEQVDTYLAELRLAGDASVPSGNGRELCRGWVHGQWLVRHPEEDGSESYTLTSHAREALEVVSRLTRERSSFSEHRVATIVNAARRFNAEANPDREARLELLNSEIHRLEAERDRLLEGGELRQATPDYLFEGFTELLGLVEDLPSDFARVQEAFTRLRTGILADFRADERPVGEVIDEYLKQTDNLMTATAEGRAFMGAMELLSDNELLYQLRHDLTALLEHPSAGDLLRDADLAELRGTVTLIRQGIQNVLAQRSRITATLREYVTRHDVTRDRELDSTLRELEEEMGRWMKVAGPRAQVPLPLLPAEAQVDHLRERLHDPSDDTPPPPLREADSDRPNEVTLNGILSQGGPSLPRLADVLNEALQLADGTVTEDSLSTLFNRLDPELRRPVEIFGLLHLATNRGDLARTGGDEVFTAVRTDGTVRSLRGPRVLPSGADPDRAPDADPVSDQATELDLEPVAERSRP